MTIITTAKQIVHTLQLQQVKHLLCVGHDSEHHALSAGTITVPALQVRRLSTVSWNKPPKVLELVSGRVSI